jgi:hypothetical protein
VLARHLRSITSRHLAWQGEMLAARIFSIACPLENGIMNSSDLLDITHQFAGDPDSDLMRYGFRYSLNPYINSESTRRQVFNIKL